MIKWVESGVLLLGRNKNLQPHGPLWNSLPTPSLEAILVRPSLLGTEPQQGSAVLEGSCHVVKPCSCLKFDGLEASMYYTGQKLNIDSSCPKAAWCPPFLAWKSNTWLACRCCVLPASDGHLNRWVHLSMTTLLQMMMQLQPKPHPQHPKQVGTLNKFLINQFNCYKFTLKNDENHSNLATTKLKFNLQSVLQ